MPWDDEKDRGKGGSLEYNLDITKSFTGVTDYNNGNTALWILEGEQEFDNGNVRESNMWISLPDDFTYSEDGQFIEDKNGDEDNRLGKNSKAQQFINSALDIPELSKVIKARTENSLHVGPWAGLKLRIREEEISKPIKDKDTGKTETRSWRQPLVLAFLGESSPGAGTGANLKSVKEAASNGGGNGSGDLLERAKAIAAESTDLIAYMDRVSKELEIPLDHQLCTAAFYDSAKA